MKIVVQLTAKDCLDAKWLTLRPRPSLRYAGYAVAFLYCFALISTLFGLARGDDVHKAFWMMTAGLVYFLLLFFVFVPWRVRRTYKQQKALQRPYSFEYDELGYAIESENGTWRMPWADVHKWKASRKVAMIYHSDAVVNLVPCSAFPSAADFGLFVDFLHAKLGPQKA